MTLPMTPVTSTATQSLQSSAVSSLCVSFQRSLEIINIDHYTGAYGYRSNDAPCQDGVVWTSAQREGWLRALNQAQTEIMRRVGAPLCPQDICGEMHQLGGTIQLRQAPVAYLGARTYGAWTEAALTVEENNQIGYIDICSSVIGESVENIQFAYPDAVLSGYTREQTLQAPRVTPIADLCGVGQDGYRFTWDIWQLVPPTEDSLQPTDLDSLLDDVKWRTYTLDGDNAYEVVGYCGCSVCRNEDPSYTLELCDATSGIVCITDPTVICRNMRTIRINYGVALDCTDEIAADLERALVLLALVKTQGTASKPCGCDNRFIEKLLDVDPSMKFEFAHKLRYGPTKAGMEVMHILDNYVERPSMNTVVTSGGFLSSNRRGRRNRYGQ